MKKKLKKIEAKIQRFIEGNAARFFQSRELSTRLARELAQSMTANLSLGDSGGQRAPNHYTIFLSPEDRLELHGEARPEEELAGILEKQGQEAGFLFHGRPVVQIVPSADIESGNLKITAEFRDEPATATEAFQADAANAPAELPPKAFLVVGGSKVFPLQKPVLNIGRRLDNQLVIDDPRVSRVHAQLRAIGEHFVVFDLGSTGGTYVNGVRVSQSVLYPGDVISLAGFTIVYGQDAPRSLDESRGYTRPFAVDQNKTITRRDRESSPDSDP